MVPRDEQPSDTQRIDQHLCVKLDGFTLHAGVTVDAHDSGGLEQLCRYIARPAVAQDRVSIRPDGNIGYALGW